MNYDDFLARVRRHGRPHDRDHAEQTSEVVLTTLIEGVADPVIGNPFSRR